MVEIVIYCMFCVCALLLMRMVFFCTTTDYYDGHCLFSAVVVRYLLLSVCHCCGETAN